MSINRINHDVAQGSDSLHKILSWTLAMGNSEDGNSMFEVNLCGIQ
jgi:hypothetical protein